MKKIQTIKELHIKKEDLKIHALQLEIAIKKDWNSIKDSLSAKEIIAQILSNMFEKRVETNNKKSIFFTGFDFVLDKIYNLINHKKNQFLEILLKKL